MRYRASRSPLTYLGGLLALYLAVPIVAFLIRLAQPGDRGFGEPGLFQALWTSVATATVSTINRAFAVRLKLYRPTATVNAGTGPLWSNDRPVWLPTRLSRLVLGITGLSNAALTGEPLQDIILEPTYRPGQTLAPPPQG